MSSSDASQVIPMARARRTAVRMYCSFSMLRYYGGFGQELHRSDVKPYGTENRGMKHPVRGLRELLAKCHSSNDGPITDRASARLFSTFVV